ncbi:hypothetical protein Agub_g14137, partial [Astrephomene gubernaculifera]
GYAGEFAPGAEQLGLDPLSGGVQVRPVLTDPRVASEVLELLLRLATAYQNYLDNIDRALQELLSCLERDGKGTFLALLRRFGRPVKVKQPKKRKNNKSGNDAGQDKAASGAGTSESAVAGATSNAGGAENGDDDEEEGEEDDISEEEEEGGKDGAAGKPGEAAIVKAPGPLQQQPEAPPETDSQRRQRLKEAAKKQAEEEKRKREKAKFGGAPVRIAHPPHHHVRPLLSVRQMARYGPGAELEVCLRKPAAHLATLAFLASVCRSITAAQDQVPELQAGTGDSGAQAAAAGGQRRKNANMRGSAASPGPLRWLWQRLAGAQIVRVLPLGADVHPIFKVSPTARVAPAATADHRVVLRGLGRGVLAAEGGGGAGERAGLGLTWGERLDEWMEQRLLAGTFLSRVLLAVCTACVCLTWRVVPLLAERRTHRSEMRQAVNMARHRHAVRQLERAINVRPEDDEALDAEVAELHKAIQMALKEAEKEMELDEDEDKKSKNPMDLDSTFWTEKAPRRVKDMAALRAALRLAEECTLHTTFAGARLMSNARRCAARMAAASSAAPGGGGGGAKGGVGGPGGGGDDTDDEADRVIEAISAAPQKKKQPPPPPPPKPAPAPPKPDKGASEKEVKAGDGGGGGSGKASAGADAATSSKSLQLAARLFGGGSKPAAAAAAGGGEGGSGGARKSAWGGALAGIGAGGAAGMAAAAMAAKRAAEFSRVLRRAVRRREHARRRWDKTLYLVMQTGALDEGLLARQSAEAVARLRRGAALSAWRQLRGVGEDLLMVFGAVAFRDVGRLFAPAMAAFLMAFPFAVLGVSVQLSPSDRSSRLLLGGLVGCYVMAGFCAMAAAVAQLRRDPSQLKVYRPSDTIRFPNFRKGTALASWKAHWVNVFALVTLLLEFWQLCAFSYQRRIPYPKTSFLKRIFPWALLDLGPAAYFLQVFALLAFMVVWIAVFFPQTPAGLKRVIMPFLGQAAYLTITSGLLSQLDCRLGDGRLVRNPDITCWTDPRHLYGAIAALLALGLYVPRATLTPFEVFFPSENLDVKYRGLYVRVVQLLRLGMAGYNLFFADSYPLTVMAGNAGVCALLALMTAIMRPCCIGVVNIMRGTGFVLATWSQVVSVAALRLSPHVFLDPHNRQWYTDSWVYVYVLVSGWVVIAAGGWLLLRRHLRLRRSAAIQFSLARSPFNYTRPPPPRQQQQQEQRVTEAAGVHQQQQPPPQPQPAQQPQSAAAPTGAAAAAGEAPGGSGERQQQQSAPQEVAAGDGNGGGSGGGGDSGRAGAGAVGGQEREGASGAVGGGGGEVGEGEKSPANSGDGGGTAAGEKIGSDAEEKDQDDGVAVSDDDDDDDDEEEEEEAAAASKAASGSGKGSRAGAAAASGAALGLPVVMAPRLLRELAKQGLLTPADEMRAYMAELVRKAEQRVDNSGREDSSDEGTGDEEGEEYGEEEED